MARCKRAGADRADTELLQGKVKFEDVVRRVPASGAHFIPAGAVALDRDALLDPDQINLTLDALDTAYDHIVIVARTNAARALFEAIQGRFDAGVLVAEGKRRPASLSEAPGSFLGFEVADIELFRLERSKRAKWLASVWHASRQSGAKRELSGLPFTLR
jgi:hypothetical protein